MLSRAVGGIAGGKAIFALPGSRKAVQLAMEKLIVPELRHIVYEVRK
jgi:molybdenum cofactor biosynthesis protein B